MARDISLIVIHCSASPNGNSLCRGRIGEPGYKDATEVIDEWHAKRGFKRRPEARARFNQHLGSIGYHHVIFTNGACLAGRHHDEIGAHVYGNNTHSLGVSLVGTDRFTRVQWQALSVLLRELAIRYHRGLVPGAPPKGRGVRDIVERGELYVCGHRDLSPDQDNDGLVEPWEWLKTCPGFDVTEWMERGMLPVPANLFNEPPQAGMEAA